ncbi:all-trans-retinol 13,14-reductase [Aneurinibacillus soli]|uniref:Phytoene desaturase (Lycopene-forming) n=1 Tax=Aneurinibacillus soli TaxID=1500254 RepID=A0A0U5B3M2_9BACL|nr:NAD(P)/FAD-dependent oxidoreductase [Aneurinibacillus soli]PYE64018.1 all-trans-retinol 13,14-reductase [Aneurinibacillus soli]BAU27967.1 Phytoene desaturase (lycopene-forming) [Aneurinibacillus soli]
MKTIGLLARDFIPLLLALFVQPQQLGLLLAVLAALGLLIMQIRVKKVKTLTAVNALFLTLAIIISSIMPNVNILAYSQLAVYAILACTTLLSLGIGELFTMQYAKDTTPEAIWTHPLFYRINRILTGMWAGVFTLCAIFAALTTFGVLDRTIGILLANAWCVPGFIANMMLPPYMQRRYAESMRGTKRPELDWEPVVSLEASVQAGQYDVIIVGSGIGGLTAGAELAAAGARVLVLEQHMLAGGACTTYTRRGGFRLEAGVESVSGLDEGGPLRHLLARHGLLDRIEWLKNTYEFRDGEEHTIIPETFEAWRDRLAERFPKEKEHIHALFTELAICFTQMRTVFGPDRLAPRIPNTIEEMNRFAEQNPNYLRWQGRTWKELLSTYTSNQAIHRELSFLAGYVGDAGEETSADAMIPLMGYFIYGGFRPRGGSQVLADALVARIRECGGDVLVSTDVQKIIIENNQVQGVQTKKQTYHASTVISNADPRLTYETLVGLEKLPSAYGGEVKKLIPSMSLFVWSAALSKPFATKNLIHYKLPEPITLPGTSQTITGIGIHSPSACDASLAPDGQGTLTVNIITDASASRYKAMTPEEYSTVKQEVDRMCRAAICEIDPAMADAILWTEVATPKTMARYLRTYEGSVYSSRRSGGNAPDFPHHKAPVQGLYLAGAGVGYGPGIEAVVISGGVVAEELVPYFANRSHIHTA